MNGLVKMPGKMCATTREAMTKEDGAGEELKATAHKSKRDENTTLMELGHDGRS
jgi:hypothetical protein